MGPFLVVVPTPILHLFACVRKAHEPVSVQTLRPKATIERFDVRIIRGFSGPREVEGDATLVSPQIQIARYELSALVNANA